MKLLAFLAAFLASPVLAYAPNPAACIPHADLVTAMKASGALLYASGSLADGRKLEFYMDAAGKWTPVVVSRPSGIVTKTSCSVIFADSDPGAFIPPEPKK
jgi:hypothetical protein